MPTFPTYDGPPLPNQLNPIDPRHWWVLLTWVFFYPSRIIYYLYQSDPEFYIEQRQAKWFVILGQPAYRSLIISSLLISPILSFALSGIALLCGIEIKWNGIMLGGLGGFVGGFALAMSFGTAGGVIGCVVGGPVLSLAFGVTSDLTGSIIGGVAFSLLFYTIGVMVFDLVLGVTIGLLFSVVVSVLGIVTGEAIANGLAFGIGGLIGSLQLFSWLIELFGTRQKFLVLSELGVLPLAPRLMRFYQQQLASTPRLALSVLRPLFQNPFRSHAAFSFLNQLLNQSNDPLRLFYDWLNDPRVDEYISMPINILQLSFTSTLRRVFLGELANIFIARNGITAEMAGSFVWQIGRRIYNIKANHSLMTLAQLLLELDLLGGNQEQIDRYLPITLQKITLLNPLHTLPHGDEIILTFLWLAEAYKVDSIENFSALKQKIAVDHSDVSASLRPKVLEMIIALADIRQEMVDYIQISNPSNQKALLTRAFGLLIELESQAETLKLPEQILIMAVIGRWQQVIAFESVRIGDRTLREMGSNLRQLVGSRKRLSHLWQTPDYPFTNPYVTGRPVTHPLFVGRNDILHQIAERWRTSHTPDSIILYGHRRMGKTSIVQNLVDHAPAGSMLVYLDLAGATATAEQSGDLLLDLADKIHAAAATRLPQLPQPQFSDYQHTKSADLHFQRLLRAVIDGLPDGAFLILALDEFEALERAITRGKLPTEVYGYLRMLSQQPRLLLVLAGLHTLDEMSRDYQQAFFSSYHNVRVSYLPLHEAERLIARPTPDFTLNYERSVIEAIYHQTYGQPLLIQSICSALVNHLNHELFDLEVKREARILPTDLDAILTDNFVQKESRYFEGIWRDQIADFPDQQRLLHILARHPAPLTLAQLVTRSSLPVEAVNQALQALAKRDVVIEEGGQWRLLIPLFQRWLRLQESQNG